MNPILIFHTSRKSKNPLRFLALAAGVSALLMAGTSCSTTKGFGQDVEKTGEKIQDAARR